MRSVLIRSVLAGAILCSSTMSLEAGCGVYQSYSYATPTVYAAPVVEVKKVVAVEYLAVPVVTPVYAIGYAPAYAPAPAAPAPAAATHSPCETKLSEVNARLAALEARLSASGAGAGPMPQSAPPPPMAPVGAVPPGGRSVFAAKCAGCHDASVARAKGGKLELFQNGVALPLSAEQVTASLRQMMAGKMPKNGAALTDQEFTQVMSEILSSPGK